ncbi:lysozyme [Pontibacter ummariensis]|uniref:Lysozyme n=1 Tax=Pontibacter ummariensis TaxID=1610492 RepID=A0A239GI05_9BACT|nr:glycoside hydrolase family 25 protein [Pontibacter ummariensis]PRY11280.1 lysozyme [Pontibacter ummariensis]SNS68780.1 lysozyme [Pontibacter ummariensis]
MPNPIPVKRKARPKKKKQPVPVRFWVGLGVIGVLLVLVLYVEMFVEKPKPVWPEGHTIYGVDVSHYQQEIDWHKVRESEMVFTFIKATEGETLKDKLFQQNWEQAGEAALMRGAYHFYLPYLSPEKQAKHFINTVSLSTGDLPPVLDIEVRGRKSVKQLREDLSVWLQLVEVAYGARPIIYTNYKFYQDYLAGYFDTYPLWIAHYRVPKLKLEKSNKLNLTFWQHTDEGTVEGIKGAVDCNVFYGSMRDLKSICVP